MVTAATSDVFGKMGFPPFANPNNRNDLIFCRSLPWLVRSSSNVLQSVLIPTLSAENLGFCNICHVLVLVKKSNKLSKVADIFCPLRLSSLKPLLLIFNCRQHVLSNFLRCSMKALALFLSLLIARAIYEYFGLSSFNVPEMILHKRSNLSRFSPAVFLSPESRFFAPKDRNLLATLYNSTNLNLASLH